MARRPFNMLRAVFYLLAAIILAQIAAALFAGATCFWFNLTVVKQVGTCMPVTDLIRQQWDKMFEAILALLIAASAGNQPPSPPPPPPE